MRSYSVALVALVAIVQSPSAAHAQSFFEKLFGLSPLPAAVAPPAYSRAAPAAQARSLAPVVIHSQAERSTPKADADGLRRRTTGRFRAVCVRLCDGFYWPMNDRATTQTLYETADRCKASCGTEAKLFYTENDDIDPGAMTDLSGKRYDALRTAFVYREKLIAGCSCKPAPWSAAEQSRHQGYALAVAQAAEKLRVAAAAEAARKEADKARAIAAASPRPTQQASLESRPADDEPAGLPSPPNDAVAEAGARAEVAAGAIVSDESYLAPTAAQATPTPAIETAGRVRARTIRVSERFERPMGLRPRAARGPADMRPQKVAASGQQGGGGFGLFGGGKPKYVWPGDR